MVKVKISYKGSNSYGITCVLKIYKNENIIKKGCICIDMNENTIFIILFDKNGNNTDEEEYECIRLEILKEIFYIFVVRMKYILQSKHKYNFYMIDDDLGSRYQIAEYRLIESNISIRKRLYNDDSLLKGLLKYDKINFDRNNKKEAVISHVKEVVSQIMAYEKDNVEEAKDNGKLFIRFPDFLDSEEKEICREVLHAYFRNPAVKMEEEKEIPDNEIFEESEAYYRGVELYEHNGKEYLCYKKMPVCEYELEPLECNSDIKMQTIIEIFNKNKEEKRKAEKETKELLEDDT